MEHLRPEVNISRAIVSERRRRPRQKIHTPAYARFNANLDSPGRDLTEILDISENGIAIQAVPRLQPNQRIKLSIDLSETKTNIHTIGTVIWSDASGRAGISLPDLPDRAVGQLRYWMLQNALAACASVLPTPLKISQLIGQQLPATTLAPGGSIAVLPPQTRPPRTTDHTALLAALAAVQKEVASFGNNLDAALQLVVERAQAFTLSTGAAIALAPAHGQLPADMQFDDCDGSYMICRASSGSGVPRAGAQLHVGSGFSGECVRSGRLLRCDDSESDRYVDRESCRLLGIRSMLAAPIRLGTEVIGILEVFSPLPNAFNESDSTVLQRLAETVVVALNRTANPGQAAQEPPPGLIPPAEPSEYELTQVTAAADLPQRLPGIPVHRAHLIVLLTVAALIATVLGFLLAPWVDGKLRYATARQAKQQLPLLPAKSEAAKTVATATTIDDLRNLAHSGDAVAQFALGARYMTGEDVKQDYAEAIRWFTQAADHGHVGAQSALGAYYWLGRGVAKNLPRAYFWSILARAQGDETSKYRVAVIGSGMSRSQILAAELEADQWIKQHQLTAHSGPASPNPSK
jgi:hypothetical protein